MYFWYYIIHTHTHTHTCIHMHGTCARGLVILSFVEFIPWPYVIPGRTVLPLFTKEKVHKMACSHFPCQQTFWEGDTHHAHPSLQSFLGTNYQWVVMDIESLTDGGGLLYWSANQCLSKISPQMDNFIVKSVFVFPVVQVSDISLLM